MVSFVTHVSRATAEAMAGQPTWGIISITDSPVKGAMSNPAKLVGWRDVFRLEFDDITHARDGYVLFSSNHARQIIRWATGHQDLDKIYVHCEMGISRSAAVARFIAVLFNLPFDHHRGRYFNQHVFDLLCRSATFMPSLLASEWEPPTGKQMTTQPPIFRVWKTNPNAMVPTKQHDHDIGFDLAVCRDETFVEHQHRTVDLGIVVQAPPGYYFEIVSRSSLFGRHGLLLVNGVGIIDPSYCGPNDTLKATFWPTYTTTVRRGDRILQLIPRQVIPGVVMVNFTGEPYLAENRGGIGSTGA